MTSEPAVNFIRLARLVRKVPFYCGRADCVSEGCRALQDARELIREISNNDPDTWDHIYGDKKDAPVPRNEDER
jgi:hypothetical protein